MPNTAQPTRERFNWIRLARTSQVGPITFQRLIRKYGSASKALHALPGLGRGGPRIIPANEDDIEQEIAASERIGARLLCSFEVRFPRALTWLDPPPPVITVRGASSLFVRPAVAIVGARNASAAGLKLARDISCVLGSADFVIVSGMARGIDGAAHTAALPTGTIAVLAGGIDQAYPPQNRRLYDDIADRGLLVSERPFGCVAQARDFPRRNRIVTGLSLGVVIIEAAERSGSLISARVAGEQGREVMAVPGSPLDPRAAGTNRLLREGAILVRDAHDVIEALSALDASRFSEPERSFESEPEADTPIPDAQIDAVRQTLSLTPMPVDEIARAVGLSAGRCNAILMELELCGIAQTFAGGSAALRPGPC